jgi:hypothetical protein
VQFAKSCCVATTRLRSTLPGMHCFISFVAFPFHSSIKRRQIRLMGFGHRTCCRRSSAIRHFREYNPSPLSISSLRMCFANESNKTPSSSITLMHRGRLRFEFSSLRSPLKADLCPAVETRPTAGEPSGQVCVQIPVNLLSCR